MSLRIEIEINDLGSVEMKANGDMSLLAKQSACVESRIRELVDNANLDVQPRNVLERFVSRRDEVVESVKAKLTERSAVGLKKYGTPLTRRDVDTEGWLDHLQQELLDAANYCECLIRKFGGKS